MSCCSVDNTTNLGCIGSCQEEVILTSTEIVIDELGDYKAYANFNGALICIKPLIYTDVEGTNYLTFTNDLNEDYVYKILIYQNDVLIHCYKLKILPELCC